MGRAAAPGGRRTGLGMAAPTAAAMAGAGAGPGASPAHCNGTRRAVNTPGPASARPFRNVALLQRPRTHVERLRMRERPPRPPSHGGQGPRPGPGADDVQRGGRGHREGGGAAPPHAPALPALPAPGAPRGPTAGGRGGRVHVSAEAGAEGGHEEPPLLRKAWGTPERLEAAAAGAEDPGATATEEPHRSPLPPHPAGATILVPKCKQRVALDKEETIKKLESLEKKEEEVTSEEEEEKEEEEEGKEEEEEEYDEEEHEEETDYIMSYFDNGEDFGADSDDNMDEAVY
ncbi:DNA-directed RNA polymerase III subunit RPC7-like isoform X3 [Lathamus discolor]|uniref:DNA-directed RNA polymerase III subunit RPC7-like isoform X3 n=1 Tax=Lathamus discolor TaxID=678569 RepID=UPI0032B75ADC